jgi:hypothetical protein
MSKPHVSRTWMIIFLSLSLMSRDATSPGIRQRTELIFPSKALHHPKKNRRQRNSNDIGGVIPNKQHRGY